MHTVLVWMLGQMSDSVVVASIGAIAVICSSLVTAAVTVWVTSTRNRKVRDRIETEQQRIGESLQRRSKYGLRARRAISSWQITDQEGTLHRTQRVEGLKVDDGVSLAYVQGHTELWTPGSTVQEQPHLSETSEFPKTISFVLDQSEIAHLRWRLVVAGSLTQHDPPLDYTIRGAYHRGVLMSNEAVARAYASDEFNNDYFAWDAEVPVETVELAVNFPISVFVKCFPGVFWGQSEWFFHDLELSRVRDGFSKSDHGGRFVIEKPTIGFRYFIYWTFL